MATKLATPGVYLEENSVFGNTVVEVSTSIPAFVGFTQKASKGDKSILNIPTRISSFSEYQKIFGGPSKTKFDLSVNDESSFSLKVDKSTKYMMYDSIRLFFSNGGGICYIVSVGDYSGNITSKKIFNNNGGGIQSLERVDEPTLLLVPDAVLLSENECYSIQAEMLAHCGSKMKNRFAILDVYGGMNPRTFDDSDPITRFREGIGSNNLSWGASYYPFLNTTICSSSEVDYTRLNNIEDLVELLLNEAQAKLDSNKISQSKFEALSEVINRVVDIENNDISSTSVILSSFSSIYNRIISQITELVNILPPSSAMAGAYTMVDQTANVSKSPANISLGAVVSPVVSINSDDQEDMNVPLNGKAVNAIRSFTGKGTLVWGARTLDGNSQDWRYINVRRTMTFLEQSIKAAAEAYVFASNNAATWTSLRSTVSNFLNNQWLGGLLEGGSPSEAFSVEIGLGSTMTANDVLDGVLKMTVKVALVRPAEFLVLTFEQKQNDPGGDAGGDEGGEAATE